VEELVERESALAFRLSIPKLRPVPALAISLGIVAVLGFIDYAVGSELSFSIFYLLPVTFAVMANGLVVGLVVSAVSAAVWLVADITAGAIYSSAFIPVWNAIVRLGYFTLHCFLIGRLMDMIAAVRDLSLNDPLTKAANWRFFEEYANKAIKSAIRERRPLTLAFLDLDNFKALNDRLGHAVGDEALLLLAKTIRADIRPEDMLARLGGDEFVLLLPGAEFEAADVVLRRLHEAVTKEMAARGWGVTASVGAVTFTTLSSTIGTLLARADELMYEVKRNGKNALRHQAWP
jgi:diguanylate cyclase (GGDEF)-like protein